MNHAIVAMKDHCHWPVALVSVSLPARSANPMHQARPLAGQG